MNTTEERFPEDKSRSQRPVSQANESCLTRAMNEYLETLEAGRHPDRDQLLQRYPEVAEELAAALDGIDFIQDAVPHLAKLEDDPTEGPAAEARTRVALGDFQIVRQIGRGGMGVVYEAEQLSLGRRVALKVLPFAAMLDSKQLQRFKNEARAAASLKHPNIVHVYSVGSEQGVHFYAMEYVEGQTIAQVIDELRRLSVPRGIDNEPKAVSQPVRDRSSGRIATAEPSSAANSPATVSHAAQPSDETSEDTRRQPQAMISTERSIGANGFFRSAANLGVQAARALEHAHQMGIVHRDVKPSNLMMDVEGHVSVTDFGLAMTQTDANLTMSGDLLGTLRYMSPEQISGHHGTLDHRTDIYSLGITLYELLTLRPAFGGDDRQTLMRQVADAEPRHPRQINSAIPQDLETIVLKATAKEPEVRYAAAAELADDLQRFLDNQPVRARQPSAWQRIRKWLRRHPSVGVSAVLVLLTMIAGLAVGLAALSREQAKTATALSEKQAALDDAEENVRLAAEAIDRMLTRVGEDAIAHGDLEHAQIIVSEAVTLFDKLLKRSQDPQLHLRAARAHRKLGENQRLLGRFDRAQQSIRQGITLLEESTDGRKLGPECQVELARSHNELGIAFFHANQFAAAEPSLQRALQIREQLATEHPGVVQHQESLADVAGNLGMVYWQTQRLEEAERMCRRASSLVDQIIADDTASPTELSRKGVTRGNIALILAERGKLDEAEQMVREAFGYFQRAYDKRPDHPEQQNELYIAHWNLTDIHIRQGQHTQADHDVERMIQVFPRRMQAYVEGIALLLRCADLASQDNSGNELAERYRQRAGQLLQQSQQVTDQPPQMANDLAWQLANWPDTSYRDPSRAVRLVEQIVQQSPKKADYWTTLGAAQYRAGDWPAAVSSLKKSVELSDGGQARDWLFLAMAHWQLGEKQKAQQWYEEAVTWAEENQPYDDELHRLQHEAADLLGAMREAEHEKDSDARASDIDDNLGGGGMARRSLANRLIG